MKVLIVGAGGREHALAWKAAQSDRISKVYVAPGNAGTKNEAKCENVNIAADDIDGLLTLAAEETIDLTIIGPEAPLVMGIVDRFAEAGLACFGPSKLASQLEGSKAFSKDFLARHNIPTAAYGNFEDIESAREFILQLADKNPGQPIVVKADGLAAGKGVVIAESADEALATAADMLSGNAFGNAGSRVVIEEFLVGEEASFICIVSGQDILPLATSQDHKAAHDGDTGPNTGGMGAYSPAPVVTSEIHSRIMDEVIRPTVQGMAAEGMPYTGFLYAGIMVASDGTPNVLEFNCRFGDPETQPILSRLQSDLTLFCEAAINGRLADQHADWDARTAIGIVMAAKGYPSDYPKGQAIAGLNNVPADIKVFHAGTSSEGDTIVTSGGRVLCVTALGDTVAAAQQRAYLGVDKIQWDGSWCRRDIGWRAIEREQG